MAPKNISRRHSSQKRDPTHLMQNFWSISAAGTFSKSLSLFSHSSFPIIFSSERKMVFRDSVGSFGRALRDIEKEAQYAAFAATKKYHRHRGDVDLFAVHRRNKQPPSLAASRPTPPENAAFDVRWCVLVCRSSVDSEKKRQRFIQLEKASKSTTLGDC